MRQEEAAKKEEDVSIAAVERVRRSKEVAILEEAGFHVTEEVGGSSEESRIR